VVAAYANVSGSANILADGMATKYQHRFDRLIEGIFALSPLDAASCGVYIHAAAAEELRHSIGDAGLMATDLLPEIPRQIMALKTSR
ncbi:MAG: hypothetical protein IIB33_02200, partial [Chloroflexi bacterium]|nr:hypothetical protein [Chloroflexota bacterium]